MSNKLAQKALLKLLPKRHKSSNKTDGGTVLIVAGGTNFKGAGLLSALAATRSGAGYTHLMTSLKEYPWAKFPDFILHKFGIASLKKFKNHVIAIGPGLGTEANKERLIKYLLREEFEKVVLDADALTILSKTRFKRLPSTWILTPHEGELARLLKIKSELIKKNREYYLERAYLKFGCVILLKGAETLVVDESGMTKSPEAPSALAKAGTGDVLLGIIAALYAQGVNSRASALLGAMIHRESAKAWLKRGNDHLGLRPVDLIEEIPKTFKRLRK